MALDLDIFALVATHEGHKTIRDPVEKLYSRISLHETLVKQSAQNFCFRLDQARDANEPINLSHACLSLAIGMKFMFMREYELFAAG